MTKVYSQALDEHLETQRIIGHIEGKEAGPCLIFFGGVHGNEPSGVFALNQVFEELERDNIPVRGNIYGLAGNLWALGRSERFHQVDLNRLWTREKLEELKSETFRPENEDEKQQLELYEIIQEILSNKPGPFYFFDLHTTSSETVPFLTVNDSLLNRQFAQQYPAPMILGIEEFLDGPLLSYINELGYVSFGFESGQHHALSSVHRHKAFIYLSLVFSEAVEKVHVDYENYFRALGQLTHDFYEIYHRHKIEPGEKFQMEPGFVNFQTLKKGQCIAESDGQPVHVSENTIIFMPLYQALGEDGFFLIRKIPAVWLRISTRLRKWHFDRLLPLLPGITRSSANKDTLLVDLRIARLLTQPILHLLGYRSKKMDDTHLIIRSRETHSKVKEYTGTPWKT